MLNEKKVVYVKGLGNWILHNLGQKPVITKSFVSLTIIQKNLYELQKTKDFIP